MMSLTGGGEAGNKIGEADERLDAATTRGTMTINTITVSLRNGPAQ